MTDDSISASDCEDVRSSLADSDRWDDEDSSEESLSEEMEIFEQRFLSLVDSKIKSVEAFCDHKQYVLSFALPNFPLSANIVHMNPSRILPNPVCESIGTQTTGTAPVGELLTANVDSRSDIESTREEIAKLRIARDVFVGHMKKVGERVKKVEKDVRWMYQCEEVIDIIDTVIEIKNEIICGRGDTFTHSVFIGKGEENLMSRLNNLSSSEHQKLFCKMFDKQAEFRHSTKQLENYVDELEAEITELKRRCSRHERKMQKLEKANTDSIKMILDNSKHPNMGRHEEDRHRHHRTEPGCSSWNFGGGVYDSVRGRDRHHRTQEEAQREHRKTSRHRGNGLFDSVRDRHHRAPLPGTEIKREPGKLTIHVQQPHQNHHN